MVPVAGTLIEDASLRYVYSIDCLEELEVYNSPNCDEEHLTGLRLHPGAIVRAVAQWTTTVGAVSATVTPGQEEVPAEQTDDEVDSAEELVFIKMADDKGWVPMFHPVTGGQILTLISTPPSNTGIYRHSKDFNIYSTDHDAYSLSLCIMSVGVSTGDPTATLASTAAQLTVSAPSTPAEQISAVKDSLSRMSVAASPTPTNTAPVPPPHVRTPLSKQMSSGSSSGNKEGSALRKKKSGVITPPDGASVATSGTGSSGGAGSRSKTPTATGNSSSTTATALDKPRRRTVKPISDN